MMRLLRQGDIVKTVCEITSRAPGRFLPRGALGSLGPFLCSEEIDDEVLDLWDFVPADYPGEWSVNEYQVCLIKREK